MFQKIKNINFFSIDGFLERQKPFNFKNKIKSVKAVGQKDLILGEIDGFWFLATDLTFPAIIEVENTKGEKAKYTYTEAHTDLVDTDSLI